MLVVMPGGSSASRAEFGLARLRMAIFAGKRRKRPALTSANARTYTERDAVSRIGSHERVLPAGRGGAPQWRQNERRPGCHIRNPLH